LLLLLHVPGWHAFIKVPHAFLHGAITVTELLLLHACS
jgi:hypothetical protein